jgi:hypothetical protein
MLAEIGGIERFSLAPHFLTNGICSYPSHSLGQRLLLLSGCNWTAYFFQEVPCLGRVCLPLSELSRYGGIRSTNGCLRLGHRFRPFLAIGTP